MAFIDYYQTLGLTKSATADDIKKAYRKLARKFHPDLNPKDENAHKKFQQINEANEVLSDPENRKKYDQYGENWQHGEQYEQQRQQQRQQQSHQQDFGNYGDGEFSDFFSSMFGGGSRSQQQQRYKGADYQSELKLSLRDAVKTHQHTLSVNGKNIRITVPAGAENGQVIKLKGYGAPGSNGGPNGDLYITFVISADSEFKRLNDNLYKTVAIDLYNAVLGGETTVTTLDGKVKLKIAAGTQNGTKVRLKNKGMPVYKKEDSFGDLFITYEIKIPTSISSEQLELFEKLKSMQN